ncbi:MAG: hypothetical protein GXP63_07640, partial [DPANN group archaeon]|nr:hypothetical protein [DPANN group archaeon]
SLSVYKSRLGNETAAHVNKRIQDLVASSKFRSVHQTDSMVVFQIV